MIRDLLLRGLPAGLLACTLLLACEPPEEGPGDGGGDGGPECAVQTDCGSGFSQVCVSGHCAPTQPEEAVFYVNARLETPSAKQCQSLRVLVIHPKRRDASTVTCATLLPSLEGSTAALDRAPYNLTALPVEKDRPNSSNDQRVDVLLGNTGRVIYVEVFEEPRQSGRVVGRGCVDDYAFEEGKTAIGVKVR